MYVYIYIYIYIHIIFYLLDHNILSYARILIFSESFFGGKGSCGGFYVFFGKGNVVGMGVQCNGGSFTSIIYLYLYYNTRYCYVMLLLYVYLYVYTYVCIYIHIYIHINIYVYIFIHM